MRESDQEAQDKEPRDEPPRELSLWTGIALAILLHSIQIPLAFATSGTTFFYIGVSQLLYIIPVIVWVAFRQKERELAKGLAIGAGITFLLNATCFGIVFAIFGAGT